MKIHSSLQVNNIVVCDHYLGFIKNTSPSFGSNQDVTVSYLRSFLFLISSGGMLQGRFLGRQSNTSSENSEKST